MSKTPKENAGVSPSGDQQNQQKPRRHAGGMPKGHITQKTLQKAAAREFVREQITKAMTPMLRAQIAHATGIGHVYTRDKKGKFKRIEDEAHIDRLLTQGAEDSDYWIFAKDPSVQAFTDLLNRAIDKPKEQEQELKVTGTVDIVSLLRQRHAKHKRD